MLPYAAYIWTLMYSLTIIHIIRSDAGRTFLIIGLVTRKPKAQIPPSGFCLITQYLFVTQNDVSYFIGFVLFDQIVFSSL